MVRTVECKNCPLNNGNDHFIESRDGPRHRLEKAEKEKQLQAEKDAVVEAERQKEAANRQKELESCGEALATIIMVDEGVDVRDQQHSKLFSSRQEFQESVQGIPEPGNLPQMSLAEASTHLRKLQAAARKKKTRTVIREELVKEMLGKVRAARKDLDEAYEADVVDIAASLRALDAAGRVVEETGNLLRPLKSILRPRHPQLQQLWQNAWDEAQELDTRVNVIGAAVRPESSDGDGEGDGDINEILLVNAEHHFETNMDDFSLVTQIVIHFALIAHVMMRLSRDACDFLLDIVLLIIKCMIAMYSEDEYDVEIQDMLAELPQTLAAALKAVRIDPKTVIYAACPECHHTHKPMLNRLSADASYPEHCRNLVFSGKDKHTPAKRCGHSLLEKRQGKSRPIKPFVFPDFTDHLAAVLSDPDIVKKCNDACDNAYKAVSAAATETATTQSINDVFEAEFLRTFKGPIPEQLFINRNGRMRLAFEILLDFFNPHGSNKRGNHDSIGILAVVNLNLPLDIRYKPEYMWLSIIVGPKEPNHDQIGAYLRPLIDIFVQGWKSGLRFSRIGGKSEGCVVDIALVISVNDLPASRKILGFAGHGSDHICTVCNCKKKSNLHRTDLDSPDWRNRDVHVLRQQAFAWRDADSQATRDRIFKEYGVRWSELWRLPYWNPTLMAVVDTMHCILEGLVHYHCRQVLRIDGDFAKKRENGGIAFDYDWTEYDHDSCPEEFQLNNLEREIEHVERIQLRLQEPLRDDDGNGDNGNMPTLDDDDDDQPPVPERSYGRSVPELQRSLQNNNNLPALRFVAWSLGLTTAGKETKANYTEMLVKWRQQQPRRSNDALAPRAIGWAQIKFIQHVIAHTATPSWINSVPRNYGEKGAGSIKADEWRTLATVYLPIALVVLWADRENGDLLGMLDHTMALFGAVDIVCRYHMQEERATRYRTLLKTWVDGLHKQHPHTRKHAKRSNIHIAFHISDFLRLFGPVMSWWCFPFERMIGYLQKINTNNAVGGELEGTLTTSYFRGAALRRWLRRSDCPDVIKEFKQIVSRSFTPRSEAGTSGPNQQEERAEYRLNGVNFSRASTHLGNSIVLYYPPEGGSAIAGSIQEIRTRGEQTTFRIQRQARLPEGKKDPFARFQRDFAAVTYSAEMEDIFDEVDALAVVSHCARFEFRNDRVVILNLCRD